MTPSTTQLVAAVAAVLLMVGSFGAILTVPPAQAETMPAAPALA